MNLNLVFKSYNASTIIFLAIEMIKEAHWSIIYHFSSITAVCGWTPCILPLSNRWDTAAIYLHTSKEGCTAVIKVIYMSHRWFDSKYFGK